MKENKRKDCANYAVALYMGNESVKHCPSGCEAVVKTLVVTFWWRSGAKEHWSW